MESGLRTLPRVIGNEAVVWSKESFDRQGWLDTGTEPWKARQSNKARNKGRAILISSGRLRRSPRIISENALQVIIGSDVPYARIHNFGGIIQQSARSELFIRNRKLRGQYKGRFKKGVTPGQGFTFKQRTIVMPARKFMGNSTNLRLRLYIVGKNHLIQKMK